MCGSQLTSACLCAAFRAAQCGKLGWPWKGLCRPACDCQGPDSAVGIAFKGTIVSSLVTRLDVVTRIRNQHVCLILFLFMWLPVLVPLCCNVVSSSRQRPWLYIPLLNANTLITLLPSQRDSHGVSWLQNSRSSVSLSQRLGWCWGCNLGARNWWIGANCADLIFTAIAPEGEETGRMNLGIVSSALTNNFFFLILN